MANLSMDEKISQIPTTEGTVPFKIASVDKPGFTWYKIFGDLKGGTPLVCLHGGPSAGHEYMVPFAELWLTRGFPMVLYDQIGCGKSFRLPDTIGDESLWNIELYIAELQNLLDHLGLSDGTGFHLLGHSWGSLFGTVFASSRPRGLQKLVLAGPCASRELYIRGNEINRKRLSTEDQEAIQEAIRSDNYEAPEFQTAFGNWFLKFMVGIDTVPPVILEAMKGMEADPAAQATLGGKTPFVEAGGSLSHWSAIPHLSKINVPTLVYNSTDDVCHSIAVEPFFEHIPRVRWITFDNASHSVHMQDNGRREKVMLLVGQFLTP